MSLPQFEVRWPHRILKCCLEECSEELHPVDRWSRQFLKMSLRSSEDNPPLQFFEAVCRRSSGWWWWKNCPHPRRWLRTSEPTGLDFRGPRPIRGGGSPPAVWSWWWFLRLFSKAFPSTSEFRLPSLGHIRQNKGSLTRLKPPIAGRKDRLLWEPMYGWPDRF